MARRFTLLVCDLDNTLYDWVEYYVEAFYSMVDEVIRITGCSRDKLLDDFREVHQRHHDSEHPFALLETDTVREIFKDAPTADIARELDPAFYAFNSVRKERLQLYPGVEHTLSTLTSAGINIVAHTESKLYAVVDRLIRLDLTKHFLKIYCRERSNSVHPNPAVAKRWLHRFPMDRVVELSHHQRKPDPDVLLEICAREGVSPHDAAYVGDSVARDVLMAKEAGIFAIWAKYGTSHQRHVYEKLVRVTHWTADDVVREEDLKRQAAGIKADFVLENAFDELVPVLIGDERHVKLGS